LITVRDRLKPGPLARGGLDRRFGLVDFLFEFGFAIEVQPGFVAEGMVADFVARLGDLAQGRVVFFEGGVLADDEEGDFGIGVLQ
jgi:hypothetical protein